MALASPCAVPKFWNLLSDADRYQYMYIRARLSNVTTKTQRYKRIENFTDCLAVVKSFAVRGDADDWKRCLVCGVGWPSDKEVAINTHQLKILISKCKSSINGSLLKMGYTGIMPRGQASRSLEQLFPILRENHGDIRQWTIRQNSGPVSAEASPIPMIQETAGVHHQAIEDVLVENIQHEDAIYGQSSTEICSWGGMFDDAIDFGW